eukprot:m.451372 g.451372  ORF g.451372 m.451372 type:complete len:111 (-) comp21525_c0_seq9:187-519(-)
MIPFVLPNIMAIAEGCSMVEFEELFFPHLVPVFVLEEPVQIMSIFLLKFEVLLTRTPKAKLQEHIYPILFRSLRSTSHQLQLQVGCAGCLRREQQEQCCRYQPRSAVQFV